MESLAQPPPPPGSLKRGDGGAASPLLLEEVAEGEGDCRDGPASAEEGGGRHSPSPQPDVAAPVPLTASPLRAAEGSLSPADGMGLATLESPGPAPTSESGSAGAVSGSSGAPSPPGEESRSLDSLESFSNLHSCCPSSSELNSDEEAVVAGASSGSPAPEPEGDRPAAGSQLLSASKERFPGQSVYHIKWVRWKEENTPVITQNENGPCPLLAIMNVLLLAWKVPCVRARQGACHRHGGCAPGRAVPSGQRRDLETPAPLGLTGRFV